MLKDLRMFLSLFFSILLPAVSFAASASDADAPPLSQLRGLVGDRVDRQGSRLFCSTKVWTSN